MDDFDDRLQAAVLEGPVERVVALIKLGVDPNCSSNEHGTTPMHLAAGQGHVEVIKTLASLGADIN